MSNSQFSRRLFLSNAGILAIGLTTASPLRRLLEEKTPEQHNLISKWNQFCLYMKSVDCSETLPETDLIPCAGHKWDKGIAVFIPEEEIYIQPYWIFWKQNYTSPADMWLIVYKKAETNFEKIKILNRFDAGALFHLADQNKRSYLADVLNNKCIEKANIDASSNSYHYSLSSLDKKIIFQHHFPNT